MAKPEHIMKDLVRLTRLLFELKDKFGDEYIQDYIMNARSSWDCDDVDIVEKLMAMNE